ncbi:MAG: preprotein translocase subunit SecG [Phycisphaerae bacterium]
MLALWYHVLMAFFFAFLAILLMGVILLQRGKGVGLSGAFGGAGGNTAFGAKTGDALTWITVVLASIFLLVAIFMNYWFVPLRANVEEPAAPATNDGTGQTPPASSLNDLDRQRGEFAAIFADSPASGIVAEKLPAAGYHPHS